MVTRFKIINFVIALFIFALAGVTPANAFFELRDPDRHDVNDISYTSTVITVGTSQVEVKVGGTRNALRQRVLIYNDSSSICYYGPTGVTISGSTKGVPIFKKQVATIPIGDVALYLICDGADNNFIVQELQ